jgi:hypothetical protein
MHDRLLEQVAHWNNEFLLEQYITHAEQYTAAARAVFKKEIDRRRISVAEQEAVAAALHDGPDPAAPAPLTREECTALKHPLCAADIAVAGHLLKDAQITFLLMPHMAPESGAPLVSLLVRTSEHEQAEAALTPHFTPQEGVLRLRFGDTRQRLKSFDPAGVSPAALHKAGLEISLSAPECAAIVPLGRRLLAEVDAVEQAQERVVFYYDNLEELLQKMETGRAVCLNATDCMIILEILQIYCDDPAFPESLWEDAAALLDCVAELTL